MILKHDIKSLMADLEEEAKALICFGAGNLPLYSEDMLIDLGIAGKIVSFIDNSPLKQGSFVHLAGKDIPVYKAAYLWGIDVKKYVLMIFAEAYKPIEEQLNSMAGLGQMGYYIFPEINREYCLRNRTLLDLRVGAEPLIPKKIHYFWFGGKEKSEMQIRCIESWKKHCSGYELVEWNESNYDCGKNAYVKEACDCGKWAYATDYARLDVLYAEGGFYFDTDVELIKNIDAFRQYRVITFFGEWAAPNSGAGIGAVKGHSVLKKMMETREKIPFITTGRIDSRTNSIYEAEALKEMGFTMNHKSQCIDGVCIAANEYIAPASVLGCDEYVTENTYGIHYCRNSWADVERIKGLEKSRKGAYQG